MHSVICLGVDSSGVFMDEHEHNLAADGFLDSARANTGAPKYSRISVKLIGEDGNAGSGLHSVPAALILPRSRRF